ncbi:MAG: hypothetical protein V7717_08300 [Porticoccaceae bacterium]
MSINTLSACTWIAACICAKDGVISEVEEQTMFRILDERFPDFNAEYFESALTEYFNSNRQIEDYLALVDDKVLRRFALDLAELSASADGLDVRENIALEKAYLIWGIKNNA